MLTNLTFLLFVAFAKPAPLPARVVPQSFESQALPGTRRYIAWLPPGYDQAAPTEYPVIVLLHGLGGEGADWFAPDLGNLVPTFEALVGERRVAPFIAVAPDGGGGYWTDHLGAPTERYGAFIDEVVADAQQRFRIARTRAAIVGVSMGGHGAMSRAFIDPGRYRAVVSIAGALFAEPPTHREIYKKVWGFPADREHWLRTAPLAIVEHAPPGTSWPAIFIACGRADTDRFLAWNTAADRALAERGIVHEWILVDGGHTWTTWRSLNERWLTWLMPHLAHLD